MDDLPRDPVVTATRRACMGAVAITRRAPAPGAHLARPTCDTTATVARRPLPGPHARTRLPAVHRVDVPSLRCAVVTAASSRVTPAMIDRPLRRARGAPRSGPIAHAIARAYDEGTSDVGTGAA